MESASTTLFKDKKKQSDFENMCTRFPEVEKITKKVVEVLQKSNLYHSGLVSFDNNEGHPVVYFEPNTPPSGLYDGMVMTYSPIEKTFEVSEQQAGEKQNELHIYTDTKQMAAALKSLLLGNKNRKPIKVWN